MGLLRCSHLVIWQSTRSLTASGACAAPAAVMYCVMGCMRKFVNYIAHARVEQQIWTLLYFTPLLTAQPWATAVKSVFCLQLGHDYESHLSFLPSVGSYHVCSKPSFFLHTTLQALRTRFFSVLILCYDLSFQLNMEAPNSMATEHMTCLAGQN